jgi:hypothetical protein
VLIASDSVVQLVVQLCSEDIIIYIIMIYFSIMIGLICVFSTRSGGWGVVTLEKVGNGYEGTCTDIWASETDDLTLVIEDGARIGTWSEPAVDRGGESYEISVSAEGTLITGTESSSAASWAINQRAVLR